MKKIRIITTMNILSAYNFIAVFVILFSNHYYTYLYRLKCLNFRDVCENAKRYEYALSK